MCIFRRNKKMEAFRKTNVDLEDVFATINSRGELLSIYRELCSRLHPDRFVGDVERQERALSMFKEVQLHKTDINVLKQLLEDAKKI